MGSLRTREPARDAPRLVCQRTSPVLPQDEREGSGVWRAWWEIRIGVGVSRLQKDWVAEIIGWGILRNGGSKMYTTYSYRIKDSTTRKHLCAMAGAVNFVDYCNQSPAMLGAVVLFILYSKHQPSPRTPTTPVPSALATWKHSRGCRRPCRRRFLPPHQRFRFG